MRQLAKNGPENMPCNKRVMFVRWTDDKWNLFKKFINDA